MYSFLPVVHVEGKVYAIDNSNEAGTFEISKDDMHFVEMFEARIQYEHSLFGLDDKPAWICTLPGFEGLWIQVKE
jgi:hypothetical protein